MATGLNDCNYSTMLPCQQQPATPAPPLTPSAARTAGHFHSAAPVGKREEAHKQVNDRQLSLCSRAWHGGARASPVGKHGGGSRLCTPQPRPPSTPKPRHACKHELPHH